jgi:lysophospholipase L1-like esterase
MPMTSILNNVYAERLPGFFDTYYRFTREICEKYPGLEFFDYSHDSRFVNDFSLFFDGDHLNAYGAEKFTRIVVADLEASGLLGD